MPTRRPFVVPECQRLINASDVDFRMLVQAALQTGCRYGELCALKAQDFNAENGTLHIRTSKSGKGRHVVLTAEGVNVFRRLVAGLARDDLILRRNDGSPWGAANQSRRIADACARAKIDPPINFHQLRHTWASHAVMKGVPLLVVAKNLGHRDMLSARFRRRLARADNSAGLI